MNDGESDELVAVAERAVAERFTLSARDCKRLAESFSSNHRKYLGRGPDWVGVVVDGDTIIVESRGVLTAVEKTVARELRNHRLVRLMRDRSVALAVPYWRRWFRETFKLRLVSVKYSLNITADTATLFLQVAPAVEAASPHTG